MAQVTEVLRDSKGRFVKNSAPGVVQEQMVRGAGGKFLPRSALRDFSEQLGKTNGGKTVGTSTNFSYKPPTISIGAIGEKALAKRAFNKMGPIPDDVMSVLLRNSDEIVEATDHATTTNREVGQAVDSNTQAVRENNARQAAILQMNKEIAKETRLQNESMDKFLAKFNNKGGGSIVSDTAKPYKFGTTYMPEGDPRSTLVPESPNSPNQPVKQSLLSRGVKSIDNFFGAGIEDSLKKGFGKALIAVAPRIATVLGVSLVAAIGTDFFIKGLRDSPLVKEREAQKEKTAAENRVGVNAVKQAPTEVNTIFGNDPKALSQYNALKSKEEKEQFLLSYGVDAAKAKDLSSKEGDYVPPQSNPKPPDLSNPTSPASLSSPSYTPMPGSFAPSGTKSQAGTSATRMSSGSGSSQVPSVPYQAGDILKNLGITQDQYDAFRGAVSGIESHGKYDIMGGSSGRFAGKYQMGADEIRETAQQLGEKTPTQAEFLNDPQMQERFFEAYTSAHNAQLMKNPIYAKMSPEQKLAVLGYAHNQGAGGASSYLNNGVEGHDAFGTGGNAYSRAVDTALANIKNDNVAVGDSIAVGTGKAGGMATYAKVGDSPQAVLDRINGLDAASVKGKNVTLSSGYSNNPSQVDLVNKQIAALKEKGAASIKLLGVGDRPDLVSGNDKLQQIAQSNNIQFGGALDPSNLSADRVHPKNYTQLASSARLEGPPQSSTGQAIVTSTNAKDRLHDAAIASNKAPIVAAPVTVNPPIVEAQNKTGGNHLPPVRNDDPVLLQAMRSDIISA